MQNQSNVVGWFEIAVTDMDRAKKFYSNVFQTEFHDMEMDDSIMAMFPMDITKTGSSGALLKHKDYIPSTDGTVIYFSCVDCAVEQKRVEEQGGNVIIPKMAIGEHGFISMFIDCEGNKIGLHSNS